MFSVKKIERSICPDGRPDDDGSCPIYKKIAKANYFKFLSDGCFFEVTKSFKDNEAFYTVRKIIQKYSETETVVYNSLYKKWVLDSWTLTTICSSRNIFECFEIIERELKVQD